MFQPRKPRAVPLVLSLDDGRHVVGVDVPEVPAGAGGQRAVKAVHNAYVAQSRQVFAADLDQPRERDQPEDSVAT
jgi:hypothetical protein